MLLKFVVRIQPGGELKSDQNTARKTCIQKPVLAQNVKVIHCMQAQPQSARVGVAKQRASTVHLSEFNLSSIH